MACHLTLSWLASQKEQKRATYVCMCTHFASHSLTHLVATFHSTVLLFLFDKHRKPHANYTKSVKTVQLYIPQLITKYVWVCEREYMPLWYFINREEKRKKKRKRESIKLLLRLWLLPCTEYVIAHTLYNTINKWMLFYVNKIYSLVSFFLNRCRDHIVPMLYCYSHITLMWHSKLHKI